MKARLFLGLSVCCLLVTVTLLVGLAVSRGVQAQGNMYPPNNGFPGQMTVKFGEDFMRQHGRQVVSFYQVCTNSGIFYEIYTLPSDKRFILTDIVSNQESGYVTIATDSVGSDASKKIIALNTNGPHRLVSGIVFKPEETIYLRAPVGNEITISGYYVINP